MAEEYCQDLYKEDDTECEAVCDRQLDVDNREPPPLRAEVERAIKQTANRKATGPDGVPVELFKAAGDTGIDRMHRICTAIWETEEWPDEWMESVFIPLPKKGDLRKCTNYRTIALVSHASKILLRVILERIRLKTE